jgi:ABC-type nitrate/sulfonate/bicarbonate transport system substrate-binding protein
MKARSLVSLMVTLGLLLGACAQATPVIQTVEVPVEKIVTQEVEVEKIVTQEVEVEKIVEATPRPMTDILFRQAWLPDDLYVPFITAQDKGYYTDQGIRFVNQIGSGAGTSTKVVATGSVPIGKGAASVVVQAIAEGLPITIILTEHQSDPGAVCSLPEKGIKTGKDLEGISITTSPGDAGQPVLMAAMHNAGLDADSLKWVIMDPNLWVEALLAKRVDAIGCYISNQPVDLAAQGVNVDVLTVADLGLYLPGQVVFVNNDFLANNREIVKGFVEATLQGYKYALDNPDDAAKIMSKYYPEITEDVIKAKWEIIQRVWFSPATDTYGFGWNDTGAYENLQTILTDTGLLSTKVDFSKALDNSILEEIDMGMRTLK